MCMKILDDTIKTECLKIRLESSNVACGNYPCSHLQKNFSSSSLSWSYLMGAIFDVLVRISRYVFLS